MRQAVRWCTVLTVLGVLATAAFAADPPWYQRGDTWHATMLASRAALTRAQSEATALPGGVKLSPWMELGPLFASEGKRSFLTAFAPEAEDSVTAATVYDNGKSGKSRWTPRPNYVDGQVHDLQPGDNSATYLSRTIESPKDQALKVYLGSDDGLTVFLNGKTVLSNDVPRGCSANEDIVELPLKAGTNRLMLKISNLTGGYAFYFSMLETPAGAPALDQLWGLLQRDFTDAVAKRELTWEREDALWTQSFDEGDVAGLARRYAAAARPSAAATKAQQLAAGVSDTAGLWQVAAAYSESRRLVEAQALLARANLEGLRLAIDDLATTYGDRYPNAAAYREKVAKLAAIPIDATTATEAQVLAYTEAVDAVRREALLANPLMDFDKLMLVRRSGGDGLPQNWQGNSSIPGMGYDNDIAVLSPVRPDGKLTTLYKPEGTRFVGDLDLNWDGKRLLFSMPDADQTWQVWEVGTDGTGLKQMTPAGHKDVQSFNGCYVPDGRVVFCSTACYQGVPCVGGADKVSLLYQLDPATGKVHQLTFDQDHSWCPTVLNSGRVMYTRWEYGDTPHYFTRILFNMNPDGSDQAEFYGSNSYWPNSMFYARPVPGESTKFAAIVSGHHGVRREGELVLFDPAKGRREADGVIQRIPGRGKKVEPVIVDQLVENSWPRFLHPWPLSEKYLLTACRLTPRDPWGIYLVDTFDNFVLLRQDPSHGLMEPVPLRSRTLPPVIPDRVKPGTDSATVYLADVYSGPGLAGVPRGTVKTLRLYSNHFAFPNMGGHINVAIDGPWDIKRIVGTVKVESDGSAMFNVPAKMPLAIEPCDAEGKALQLMRSWMVAMPGETLSCVGCHESQNATPPRKASLASRKTAQEIQPWHGAARGFSLRREVQPVLDKFCVGCHGGATAPDLRDTRPADALRFSPSYLALHPFVRRPGPESDYHLLSPGEFHADTSELVQMLNRGHHGVALDAEGWDRLITWIDLNAPCLGAWTEERAVPNNGRDKRAEYRLLFAGLNTDEEALSPVPTAAIAPVQPVPESPVTEPPLACAGWPFDAAEATRRQAEAGTAQRTVDLPGGLKLDLVKVPAGRFVMGDITGDRDESPRSVVEVRKPFWMGRVEVTNAQYAAFDPHHDSRVISETNKDQTRPGVPANEPEQPVIRISQQDAQAFCRWLGRQAGLTVRLPSEAEWEWAARAGTAGPSFWGGIDADFSPFANLADHSLANLARADSPKWQPREDRFDDHGVITVAVGRYKPNAWGLCDMLGNAAEWTASTYRPYPYHEDLTGEGRKVVRGGSWYDRPKRARSAARQSYPAWMRVYNVGFRVVCDA